MAGTVIESPAFQALFIAFSITLEHPLKTYNKSHLRRCLEANGFARQLLPMLMTGAKFTPDELIDKAWNAVKSLVIVNRIESEFLSSVESGTLLPNLLFPNDSELAGRIASHPALLWKIANIRTHKNLPDKIS
jgi:hypothetical protein